MIACIVLVSLALTWLAKETDWMRVRLLVGIECIPLEYERKSWEDLSHTQPERYQPNFMRMNNGTEHFSPLCGWDWLKNTMHVIPEYKIYLAIGGCRYNMNIKKDSVLKAVMRANHLTKKQKLAYV